MNQLLHVVAVVLTAIPLHVQAQKSPAASSVGTWAGEWYGQIRQGSMEMVIDATDDKVYGQVRSTNTPECPEGWAKFAGVAEDAKVVAEYRAGGRCGKTDITYSIDPTGTVMTGSWKSEWPSQGTFRLSRQPGSPADAAPSVSPTATRRQP